MLSELNIKDKASEKNASLCMVCDKFCLNEKCLKKS